LKFGGHKRGQRFSMIGRTTANCLKFEQ
jgi:hypothetical protein